MDEQKPSVEMAGDEDDSLHRVTSLAWAAFQVLADRCVSWETQDSAVLSSGLAQQVRMYLCVYVLKPPDKDQVMSQQLILTSVETWARCGHYLTVRMLGVYFTDQSPVSRYGPAGGV